LEIEELSGLTVNINDVIYMPDLEAPTDRPYPFVYFVTINNNSNESVTIRGRKWVLTQESGEVTIVEGDGVVGQFPELKVGADFSYNSYHVISGDFMAEGAFFGSTEDGRAVLTKIPQFDLSVPKWV
jgi:ApaG protein